MNSALRTAALVALAFFASLAGARESLAQEFGLYGGVAPAPGEIGRDVNRAGGDTLVASLGASPVLGARVEVSSGLVGGGITVLGWLRSVGIQNDGGTDFPHHGRPPLVYLGEARLYPFRKWLSRGQVSPYFSAGAGGTLVSVDLDNANGQELRHLWTWSAGGGVRIVAERDSRTFVDVQYRACFLSESGPLAPFTLHSIVVGVGMSR